MFPASLIEAADALIAQCRRAGLTVTTAESCTGGLIAALLTEIPGASDVLGRGYVTYSNDAKTDLLGVPPDLLARYGAVSEPVAIAMADGARRAAGAGMAISVTGIAGPGGGSDDKPVGMVCFGLACGPGAPIAETRRFGDAGRQAVRLASVEAALSIMASAAMNP